MSELKKHLAGISPYFNMHRQPPVPAHLAVHGAVYLFRHGVIEVSHYDYDAFIHPFLRKIHRLQSSASPFVRDKLDFLAHYVSWITDSHVGLTSSGGAKQCSELGKMFRQRYPEMLKHSVSSSKGLALMDVWCDETSRCRGAAAAFTAAFSGQILNHEDPAYVHDTLPKVNVRLHMLKVSADRPLINNLHWHKALGIDQNVGKSEMDELMKVTTGAAIARLETSWIGPSPLSPTDVYSMQLLHSYDIVSGRASPWEELFDNEDWAGFEYLRDTKYFFSEGYGRDHTHLLAVPWMQAALDCVSHVNVGEVDRRMEPHRLPLWIGFTHRELVLYLGCLLGINYRSNWRPSLTAVDLEREWRIAILAPYLGHVGIEAYDGSAGERSVRVIVNGDVRAAFFGELGRDDDGGYSLQDVQRWILKRRAEYDGIYGAGDLTFFHDVEE